MNTHIYKDFMCITRCHTLSHFPLSITLKCLLTTTQPPVLRGQNRSEPFSCCVHLKLWHLKLCTKSLEVMLSGRSQPFLFWNSVHNKFNVSRNFYVNNEESGDDLSENKYVSIPKFSSINNCPRDTSKT